MNSQNRKAREYIEAEKIKNENLAEIASAVATSREDLVDALNEVTHKRIMAVKQLREIANSWAITDWEGLESIRTLSVNIEKYTNDIDYAEQRLNMHDDPAGWIEYAEDLSVY